MPELSDEIVLQVAQALSGFDDPSNIAIREARAAINAYRLTPEFEAMAIYAQRWHDFTSTHERVSLDTWIRTKAAAKEQSWTSPTCL